MDIGGIYCGNCSGYLELIGQDNVPIVNRGVIMIGIKVGDKVRRHYIWNGGEMTSVGVVEWIEDGIIWCKFGSQHSDIIGFHQDSHIQVGIGIGSITLIEMTDADKFLALLSEFEISNQETVSAIRDSHACGFEVNFNQKGKFLNSSVKRPRMLNQ